MKNAPMIVALTVLAALTAAPRTAARPADRDLTAADRAELWQIEGLLRDPTAHERPGAARALASLAARYRVSPQEIQDLLTYAAADPAPEIARPASEALARIEAPERTEFEPGFADTPESRNRIELERIATLLADPSHHERSGVGIQLVNLAGSYRVLSFEVLAMLEQARDDRDPRVAGPAAAFLARLEGQPDARRAPLQLSPEAEEDLQQVLAMVQDRDAGTRWLALARLRDMPLPEVEHEMRVDAFMNSLSDADPTIRSYAWFALAALLTGDLDALAQVHAGPPAMPDATTGGQPPPSPETDREDLQPGFMTASGVFVGTTPQFDAPTDLQPLPDGAPGLPNEGDVDASGVFIGTAAVAQPG